MYYINVSQQQIEELRPAVDLLMQLWGEDVDEGTLYLYGLLNERSPVKQTVLGVAGVESNIVVLSIPINTDSLYFLTGSGYLLGNNETFAYVDKQEIRTEHLSSLERDTVVTLSSFAKLALATSDSWLDRFIKLEATEDLNTPETSGADTEHGGLVHRTTPPEVEKTSGLSSSVVDTWATTNINDYSSEELYKLLHDLAKEGADSEDTTFFMWSASDTSGYLIQTEGGNEAAAKLIATDLGLSSEEILEEGTSLTGRMLAASIEAQLGEG